MPNLLCCSSASEFETFGDVGSQWCWLLCSPAPKQHPQGSDCKVHILGFAGVKIFMWAHMQLVADALDTTHPAKPAMLWYRLKRRVVALLPTLPQPLILHPQADLGQQHCGLTTSLPSPNVPETAWWHAWLHEFAALVGWWPCSHCVPSCGLCPVPVGHLQAAPQVAAL